MTASATDVLHLRDYSGPPIYSGFLIYYIDFLSKRGANPGPGSEEKRGRATGYAELIYYHETQTSRDADYNAYTKETKMRERANKITVSTCRTSSKREMKKFGKASTHLSPSNIPFRLVVRKRMFNLTREQLIFYMKVHQSRDRVGSRITWPA